MSAAWPFMVPHSISKRHKPRAKQCLISESKSFQDPISCFVPIATRNRCYYYLFIFEQSCAASRHIDTCVSLPDGPFQEVGTQFGCRYSSQASTICPKSKYGRRHAHSSEGKKATQFESLFGRHNYLTEWQVRRSRQCDRQFGQRRRSKS